MGNPTPSSHSDNPQISAQQSQTLQRLQPSEDTDQVPTAAHRSLQPEPHAISSQPLSLLEQHPTVSCQAWLPVPRLRNVAGQTRQVINAGEF